MRTTDERPPIERTTIERPKERWAALPDAVRRDLARAGYDAAWFDAAKPGLMQTVLNVYAALTTHDLWRFVTREWTTDIGVLQFTCSDAPAFRATLEAGNFSKPRERASGWESRERRALASIHIKHFNGWDADKIQAHVDPVGSVPRWYWWVLVPLPLGLLLWHWYHWHGYADPDRVKRSLLRAGIGTSLID